MWNSTNGQNFIFAMCMKWKSNIAYHKSHCCRKSEQIGFPFFEILNFQWPRNSPPNPILDPFSSYFFGSLRLLCSRISNILYYPGSFFFNFFFKWFRGSVFDGDKMKQPREWACSDENDQSQSTIRLIFDRARPIPWFFLSPSTIPVLKDHLVIDFTNLRTVL